MKLIIALLVLLAVAPQIQAQEQPNTLKTERILDGWKTRDGENIDQALQNLRDKIGFKVVSWKQEHLLNGEIRVALTWTIDGEYHPDLVWTINQNAQLDNALFEQGSNAFALAQAQPMLLKGDKRAKEFLLDPTSYNFVKTRFGKLGELLVANHCSLSEPVWIDFDRTGGSIRIAASVNCEPPKNLAQSKLSEYFFKRALLTFVRKQNEDEWVPTSFLAQRISGSENNWWKNSIAIENTLIDFAREVVVKFHRPNFRWQELVRIIEIRHSNLEIATTQDDFNATSNAAMLVYLQTFTANKTSPVAVEYFLRYSGLAATQLSNNAIISAEPPNPE